MTLLGLGFHNSAGAQASGLIQSCIDGAQNLQAMIGEACPNGGSVTGRPPKFN